jgi:hypothetical protein
VLLDQRIVAVKGNRMAVEVERRSPVQAKATDLIEPVAHQLGITARLNAATVFGEERSLWDRVQASEEGQPSVENVAHDVAMAGISEELQCQQRPDGARGWDHLRAGKPALCQQLPQIG